MIRLFIIYAISGYLMAGIFVDDGLVGLADYALGMTLFVITLQDSVLNRRPA